ncbi:peptidoglycan-N-acetylglucosamine deacetylase [Bacillus thuringiensis]|uniref:Polysaccharide deacetylase n=7 Tax=Bacillus thuringiensis TaxID=1428 RepID=A0A9W3J7W7_BACTU|nr:polysaccharide deacetylase family protein [Bacillus thuringiensis]AFQ15708.1 polysaccharide deacetylase [Bacillus thuringiensis HD-771]MEB4894570.1 polysaccharide deacetylase [Bacillus thuringiensis]MEC2727923.1 polysaccharide deacetylase [Bacillus thuringiensis]MEC2747159.1 polysaccharide deacetylase [Bacillus thuringiensis]MEC2770603.1 polysaccharide deacetylase [Bacillus thuringiensis]
MRYISKKRKILGLLIVIMTVLISCLVFQSFTSSGKAVAKKENTVQLAHEQSNVDMSKVVPSQYNGQKRKIAYLTFDDGPGKYTSQLLDLLKKENIKATFFLIGGNVKQFPDLVKRENKEGHYVGMHSMTHDYNKLYTKGHYVDEMKEDQALIANIIGKSPLLTRPPYGSSPGLNESLRNKVVENNLKVWDWTIDSLDWKYNKMPVDKAAEQITKNVLEGATGTHEVILIHDIHPQSVTAVPAIIKGLKEKGYEFEAYNEENHIPVNFWHDNRM